MMVEHLLLPKQLSAVGVLAVLLRELVVRILVTPAMTRLRFEQRSHGFGLLGSKRATHQWIFDIPAKSATLF